MSGAPAALDQMIDHLVMGGRVALLGVPARPFIVDLSKIVFRLVTLKGIYGREMFETWYKMLAMLESGLDVRKVITHRHEDRRLSGRLSTMPHRARPARSCWIGTRAMCEKVGTGFRARRRDDRQAKHALRFGQNAICSKQSWRP